jgi:hypothetical protein
MLSYKQKYLILLDSTNPVAEENHTLRRRPRSLHLEHNVLLELKETHQTLARSLEKPERKLEDDDSDGIMD